MFLEYYGLREQPFGVTPDPRYLYFSAMHREALASLFYGIETGCGFLTLIAPPGMGKTTLLLHLLERLRRSARTVFLFQTQCDSREFFRYLLTDLGVDASNQDMAHMHESLNSVLVSNTRMGRRFVLIIDEAQNLKKTVLETVRLLSDFETPSAKLMQIVLSGQPQLADRLSHPDLMQLRQRISIVSRLHPFTRVEMMHYIHHRLNVAGYAGPPLFNYDAIDQIVAHSDGVPRNINNICFNALTLGYAKRQKQINGSIVREVLVDLDMDALRSHSVAPALATQDSPCSVDALEPSDEATYQNFHSAACAAWVNGVEGGASEGQAESDPIPITSGGNSPAAVSQTHSSGLAFAGSPLRQKAPSAEEFGAFLGAMQAPPAVAQVLRVADSAEMQVGKARNGKQEISNPAAVLIAVPGSSVEPSRSEGKEPSGEDQTQTPERFAQPATAVAKPTATGQDPSVVPIGSQEHAQGVALAPDIHKIEIPGPSSVPPPLVREVSQATLGGRANTVALSLARPTTPEGFDSQLERLSMTLQLLRPRIANRPSSIDAYKAHHSEPRKQRKLIATCGAVLFVAAVGGVPFFHPKSVGDGVVDSARASAAQASSTSNSVVHADSAGEKFKTVSTNPPKDAIPSVRAQLQQSAPMQQSIPSVTPDIFGSLNAHPVSTLPAAEVQTASASSSDEGLVISDENINAPFGITSSDDVVLPSSAYDQGGLFSVDGQVKQLELLSRAEPQYPPVAKRKRVEGDVVVDFVVEESGSVSDMNVVSGPMLLRPAALDALRRWKYKPSQVAGQPIAVKTQVTISFHLP
jgi:general secretion pathway protein A